MNETELESINLECVDCGKEFIFTGRNQQFFESNGWDPPKRCKPCQIRRKAERSMNMDKPNGFSDNKMKNKDGFR